MLKSRLQIQLFENTLIIFAEFSANKNIISLDETAGFRRIFLEY